MHHTPNRQRLDLENALNLSPISFETPRLFKYHRQNANATECTTPKANKNLIVSLISSPIDPISLNIKRLLLMKNFDIMNEFTENHYIQLDSRHHKILTPNHHHHHNNHSHYMNVHNTTNNSAQKLNKNPNNTINSSSIKKSDMKKKKSNNEVLEETKIKENHINSCGFEIYHQPKEVLKTSTIGQNNGVGAYQMTKKKAISKGLKNNIGENACITTTVIKDDKKKKNAMKILPSGTSDSVASSDLSSSDSKYVVEGALEDLTNKYLNKNACDIRKRKRKSNQQLKILKLEFEKDGVWNKDKILNMAKITGLSESQVYKWCWDQKKKKGCNDNKSDNNNKDIDLSDLDDDDDNDNNDIYKGHIVPKIYVNDNNKNDLFNLNKNSKKISKLKNNNTNSNEDFKASKHIKSIQKLKMRNTNQAANSFYKIENVNKKIDFSNE